MSFPIPLPRVWEARSDRVGIDTICVTWGKLYQRHMTTCTTGTQGESERVSILFTTLPYIADE